MMLLFYSYTHKLVILIPTPSYRLATTARCRCCQNRHGLSATLVKTAVEKHVDIEAWARKEGEVDPSTPVGGPGLQDSAHRRSSCDRCIAGPDGGDAGEMANQHRHEATDDTTTTTEPDQAAICPDSIADVIMRIFQLRARS